jgi:hypothetical protein
VYKCEWEQDIACDETSLCGARMKSKTGGVRATRDTARDLLKIRDLRKEQATGPDNAGQVRPRGIGHGRLSEKQFSSRSIADGAHVG